MRLAAAAGVLRPTAALLFHSRSRPHRLLPSPRRSSLPFARRRRHSYSSSTATALDDPPPPAAPGPPSPDAPTPTGQGGETKAGRRRRARESPEGLLKHRLDMCSRDADLATALELYEAAVDPATAVPLALHHYNCLLYLCSNAAAEEPGDADAARRGFEIFAAMEAQGVEPNEATLTSLARLAAAVRDPAMAFSVVRRMAAAGIPPRLRSYGPALFAYCDARDADGAAEVEAHMDAGGVVPEETELAALLKVNADTGRADQVYRVLHRTRTLVRQVCEATAQVVEAWFRSDDAAEAGVEKWDARKVREGVVKGGGGWHGQGWLGKGQWDVGQSEMDKDGKCQRCGEKLVCIDIDPSETETFAKSLAELACKREVRDDFVRFQDWLHRHGPFDAVIDAANVGLYKSKAFSFSQVNSVVNGIQRVTKSKKLPLIVLHRSRVNGGPAKTPQNQKLIESWRNAGALYSTPPGSNDDWYWLYAAVSCRSLLVTNDEMRDHLFQLLGTSFFPRWKEKHQVRLTYSGRGPTFHLPPPYSIVIQESEAGSWHVPTTTGDDIESPRQWVCATRKTSERPPSPPPQARAMSKTLESPPSPALQTRATNKTSERPPSPPPQAQVTRKTSERPSSQPPQAQVTRKTSERPSSQPPQASAMSKTSEGLPSPPPQARTTSTTSERPPSPPRQARTSSKTSERPPSPQASATSKTSERSPSPPPQARATSKTSGTPSSPPPQARAARKSSGRQPSPPPQASATDKTTERASSSSPKARLSDLGW